MTSIVTRLRAVVPGLLPVFVVALGFQLAAAQRADLVPDDLDDVGIEERLEAQVPLDLRFTDEAGQPVVLADYFGTDKPVVLTMIYYRCPMLCTLVLDGLVDAMREIDWVPGREFEVVTVSIDPREKPKLAVQKKQGYLASFGKPEAGAGWHFLTGDADSIEALTDAVGFRYQYVEQTDEYAHAAALIVLTPDGVVSRYLYGVRHDPRTVRLSLVEASEGRIGSATDKILLYCYRYDAQEGRYAPVAMRIMQLGGMLVAVVLGAMLLTFWLREARQKRLA